MAEPDGGLSGWWVNHWDRHFTFFILTTHVSSLQGLNPTRIQAVNASFMIGHAET
ncbi:hypothetical protein [Arthrobacter bambusae]|uniref:hypothetical protein n=1 Tax=Arthrobacter bambusae TaxID=1338426 RepID=UPI002784E2F8|nr:hypothetical protein [Arthrobacter bambusae]MDQ0032215.1 hypothetical protein [Arthrobacter bambusae]MDQ0100336.1 hypothetical protein [Arthrobacter bambusae]